MKSGFLACVCFATVLAAGALVATSPAFASSEAQTPSKKRLRMRVAVAPIDWSERQSIGSWTMPIEFQNQIHEKLIKKLVDTGRFVVLERESLQNIEAEKAIKEESSGVSQRGKLIPAQALIRGKVTEMTVQRRMTGASFDISGVTVGASLAEARVRLDLRIFGVDTGEIISSEAAQGSATTTDLSFGANIGSSFTTFAQFERTPLGNAVNGALDRAVRSIVRDLERLPWSALVAEFDAESGEAIVNAGAESGLVVGETFEVSRVSKVVRDPESGEVLGRKSERVGVLRIKSLEPRFAVAELVSGGPVRPGDIVRELASALK